MPKIAPAPAPAAGDIIELEPLRDKAIGILCGNRRSVETKYGQRTLTEVRIIVKGQKDPLEGVLFQAYFSRLEQGTWYLGIVRKDDRQWFLDSAIPKADAKALADRIKEMEEGDDVPF